MHEILLLRDVVGGAARKRSTFLWRSAVGARPSPHAQQKQQQHTSLSRTGDSQTTSRKNAHTSRASKRTILGS